jgi:glucose/arabinose dehydrogenase
MRNHTLRLHYVLAVLGVVVLLATGIRAADSVLTGAAAFGDWRTDAPGVRRKITVQDLPPPGATPSADNFAPVIQRPPGAKLKVPAGFKVAEFARGLDRPRLIRAAPNGDIFVAESHAGKIAVLRAPDGAAKPTRVETFASGLQLPFGIAFWPPGPSPQYVYVANTDSVVRFPYRNGDLRARGPVETVVRDIPGGGHLRGGGHWTRDVVFSKDGSKMFVSVGSLSNDAEGLAARLRGAAADWARRHNLGSSWGSEYHRAGVLEFNADGSGERVFATGLRNCVGMAINPTSPEISAKRNCD